MSWLNVVDAMATHNGLSQTKNVNSPNEKRTAFDLRMPEMAEMLPGKQLLGSHSHSSPAGIKAYCRL